MSEPSELLLQHLPEIEQIIASVCRRSGMDSDATEEFAAEVKLRLVDKDYAVIRGFQNRSSFAVYIAAVVKRMLLDHRNHEWGKWRPSAEAQRLGELGVALERLLYRDRRTMDEAAVLLADTFEGVSRTEIERLAACIPTRTRRVKVALEEAAAMPARDRQHDPLHNDFARRLSELVSAFIDRLPADDQLLLRLRFQVAMSVAQIARAMQLDQAALYRRLYRHFDALRAELAGAGVSPRDVEELIGSDTIILDFHLKNRAARPSEEDERAVAVRQEESS